MNWTKKLIKVGIIAGIATNAFAGGNIAFNWDNDGAFGGTESPFFSNQAGTIFLPLNNLIELVALQGGTNFVLASTTVGTGGDPIGLFQASSTVSSNTMAGAFGSVLGVKFYNASTIGSATAYGIVSNLSITAPSPNYSGIQPLPTLVELDVALAPTWLGPRTSNNLGFYTDTALIVVPEPSTVFLVGMGLVGAWVLRRRKRL